MSSNSAKDLSLHISPWQLHGYKGSNYDVAACFLQHHCTSGPVINSQSPLLGIFLVSLSVVSGCSFGKGIQKRGKWLWSSCKGLSGVSCGTEVPQQQPGQINCCKECLGSWLCSSPVPDSLGSQSRSLTGMEMTNAFFTDWVFCSLVDWNCSAKDQLRMSTCGAGREWNSPALFQLSLLSLSHPSVPWLEGVKVLLLARRGEKSATGVSPLMGILIPLLISARGCNFFLVVNQGFTFPLHGQ